MKADDITQSLHPSYIKDTLGILAIVLKESAQ